MRHLPPARPRWWRMWPHTSSVLLPTRSKQCVRRLPQARPTAPDGSSAIGSANRSRKRFANSSWTTNACATKSAGRRSNADRAAVVVALRTSGSRQEGRFCESSGARMWGWCGPSVCMSSRRWPQASFSCLRSRAGRPAPTGRRLGTPSGRSRTLGIEYTAVVGVLQDRRVDRSRVARPHTFEHVPHRRRRPSRSRAAFSGCRHRRER